VREDEEVSARGTRRPRVAAVAAVLGLDSAHVDLSDSEGGRARSNASAAID
jgi:hypothetical protein